MNLYVWGITLFAAFGGFLFGYDIGYAAAKLIRPSPRHEN